MHSATDRSCSHSGAHSLLSHTYVPQGEYVRSALTTFDRSFVRSPPAVFQSRIGTVIPYGFRKQLRHVRVSLRVRESVVLFAADKSCRLNQSRTNMCAHVTVWVRLRILIPFAVTYGYSYPVRFKSIFCADHAKYSFPPSTIRRERIFNVIL